MGEFIVAALQPFAIGTDNRRQQVKRAVFITRGFAFAIGEALRQFFTVLAHQFAYAVGAIDFFHAALWPGMVRTVAELRGEAQRVFYTQQTAEKILLSLRHAAIRCDGFSYLV